MIGPSFIKVIFDGLKRPNLSSNENDSYQLHLSASLNWIQRAYQSAGDGGISKGYDLLRDHWAPSYPETTGYTIPTLLNAGLFIDNPEYRILALSLADYLLRVATPEGGVAHWQGGSRGTPIVFDTGQVIFGWLAAFRANQDEQYLNASKRAGDWLISIQDESGSWRKNQHLEIEKVIDTRVAWALIELYLVSNQEKYLNSAICNLNWSIKQQELNGWFNHCAFNRGVDPFTHTIAYTAEGLLECGSLLSNSRYIESARLTVNALLGCQRTDGSLASTYSSSWHESSHSCCLTGLCQTGQLWLKFHEISGDNAYLDASRKAISFVSSTQSLNKNDPDTYGAIAGSYPIYGSYERFKYPNWATKFFIDSILALAVVEGKFGQVVYKG